MGIDIYYSIIHINDFGLRVQEWLHLKKHKKDVPSFTEISHIVL